MGTQSSYVWIYSKHFSKLNLKLLTDSIISLSLKKVDIKIFQTMMGSFKEILPDPSQKKNICAIELVGRKDYSYMRTFIERQSADVGEAEMQLSESKSQHLRKRKHSSTE